MAVRSDLHIADAAYETTGSGLGGKIFIWLAWALAAGFWAFTLTTALGIVRAGDDPALRTGPGPMGAGGVLWLLMEVIGGVVILGAGIAWGMTRWAGRDKSLDPITEAATRVEYDMVEAAGGDDDIHRSPEAHKPEERDAYRAIKGKYPRKL